MVSSAALSRDNRIGLALILLAAAGALAFRLPLLDLKPFHGDEANQAFKAGVLLETGDYAYDPIEHHGPTIYYMMLPFAWLTTDGTFAGTTESTYRIVPVLFGAAIVLLMIPLRGAIGTRATFIAAVLTAISPAMVYYSRYYIQEMLLVFFAFGAIVAGWYCIQRKSYAAAIAAGLCFGLAHASKETCVLAFVSYFGAWVCTAGWSRLRDGDFAAFAAVKKFATRNVVVCILAAVAVSMLFFSSFFTHPRGVINSVLAYTNYSNKAGNFAIHDKPWRYYLQMLLLTRHSGNPWFSEALILALGAKGIVVTLLAKRNPNNPSLNLLRFLAFYTLGMTAAYSLIPYKTPWCALNFLQPLIVMAGVGADALIRGMRWRPVKFAVAAALALLMLQLGMQAYRSSFVYYADVRNPYVYAHTSSAISRLAERIQDIPAFSPEGNAMLVGVVAPDADYWPLPWYLRKMKNVGYWTSLPADLDAPLYTASMIVVSPKITEELAGRLRAGYHSEMHALRPGVLRTLFIRTALWEKFMETRQNPVPEPG